MIAMYKYEEQDVQEGRGGACEDPVSIGSTGRAHLRRRTS